VGAGFDSDIGGDVPDWDNTESRESDEDAAWRELVARFAEPVATTEPAPWPERENVPGPLPRSTGGTGGATGGRGRHEALRPQEPDAARGTESRRGDIPRDPDGFHGADGPRGPGGHRRTDGRRGTDGHGTDGRGTDGRRGAGGFPAPDGSPDAGSAGSAPWPDAPESTGEPGRAGGAAGTRDGRGPRGEQDGEARGAEGMRGFDDEGARRAFRADRRPGAHEPDVIQAARRERRGAAHGTRARRIRARKVPPPPVPEDDEGRYIPPEPPPLPKLDTVTKGAWAALFGGPAYLVVATAVGWSVPGIAAFLAVAAFVTGFAILVLRMNESSGSGPGGPDGGDDGAVV
jgi:hypothetical protein